MWKITHNTVKSYLLDCMKSKGNNPVTINTKIKNLRAFFNYMVRNEIFGEKRNPMIKIEKEKTETKIEVFSDNYIKQMLGYYRRLKGREHSFYAYRDHTIILTLLGSGIRLGELCNLTWKEVDLIRGTIIVFGKKRAQASIPITHKLVQELAEYKVFCQQLVQVDKDKLVQILASISGLDHHDWIQELCNKLGKDLTLIIESLTRYGVILKETMRKSINLYKIYRKYVCKDIVFKEVIHWISYV